MTTFFVLHAKVEPIHKQTVSAHFPDAFIVNATITQFGETGTPQMVLVTPKGLHYVNGVANLALPHITVYNPKGTPWIITAKYGQGMKGLNDVYLWDHVHIQRNASPENKAMTVLTTAITYNTQTKFARTNQTVTIIQPPGDHMTGVGMRSNLKTGLMNLLGNVRGQYVSPPTKKDTHEAVTPAH